MKWRAEMWTSASISTPASAASRAASRAVEWPVSTRPVGLRVGERGVVDQQVGPVGGDRVASHGRVSPVITSRRPRRVGPSTCSGSTGPSLPATSSPRCSLPKSGPSATPSDRASSGVEAAGPRLLDERVAEGGDPVLDRERLDRVAVEADAAAGLELVDLDRVADAADDPVEAVEEVGQPRRPVDDQRLLAVLHVPGLEQAREAEVVVGVQVGDEDLLHLDEPGRALHLPLRALAAVEQQPVAAAADEHRAVLRRADGTEPPVPRKIASRSIAPQP